VSGGLSFMDLAVEGLNFMLNSYLCGVSRVFD
jgi:hypothetical protein